MNEQRKKQFADLVENRVRVLLIIAPPTFGMILGGVLVSLWGRAFGGVPQRLPHDYVTVAFAMISVAVLALISRWSALVWRGKTTRFPTVLKAAPFTSAFGLALGTLVAALKSAGLIT